MIIYPRVGSDDDLPVDRVDLTGTVYSARNVELPVVTGFEYLRVEEINTQPAMSHHSSTFSLIDFFCLTLSSIIILINRYIYCRSVQYTKHTTS